MIAMAAKVLFFVFFTSQLVLGQKSLMLNFVYQYFKEKATSQVVSILCDSADFIVLHKKFSDVGIYMSSLNPEIIDHSIVSARLTSKYLKLGIIVDLKCKGSIKILQTAHENDLFIQTKSLTAWLILFHHHIPEKVIRVKAESYQGEVSDPVEYLLEPHHDTNNSKKLIEITRRINAEFIKSYEKFEKPKPSKQPLNVTGIDAIIPLNILLDNDVELAIPLHPNSSEMYDLYRLYKVTKESKTRITRMGSVFAIRNQIHIERLHKRTGKKSFEGALLKGVCPIYNLDKFTYLEDLSTKDLDAWPKMTYTMVKLLSEDLNFRLILRFYDDYGWKINNSFTALVGKLERREADITAATLVFRHDRYDVIDYMDSPFRLEVGIIFREPSLSSVRNIFILPFSSAVWMSMLALIILIVFALKCEAIAASHYKWSQAEPSLLEIMFLVWSALSQQGHNSSPVSTTGRLIFFLLLFTCLALFTAFSAKIVTAMQSFSSSILTVTDMTSSSFEVGIQEKLPILDIYFKEAVPSHEVIRDFYNKKILPHWDHVHMNPRDGIEKIRHGLFAFEVELTAAYKLISDIYEERDKCGLKEIDIFPKPYLGSVVPKNSPFKEIITTRFKWHAEIGLLARTWKLWFPQKPKCEVERIGFISVGFTELYPAVMCFVSGFTTAILILILEIICEKLIRRVIKPRAIFNNFIKRRLCSRTISITSYTKKQ